MNIKNLVVLLTFVTSSLTADIGSVTAIRGDVKITRGIALYQAHINLEIEQNDTFFTGRRGSMQITFDDNTVITLGRNTVFKVQEYLYNEKKPTKAKAVYKFQKGYFKSITGRIGKIAPKNFKIKTKNSTIGVRGTQIVGNSNTKKETIICTKGAIAVQQGKKTVIAQANQKVEIKLDPRVNYTVASPTDVMVHKQVELGIKKATDPEVMARPKADVTKTIKKSYKKKLQQQDVTLEDVLATPIDTISPVKKVEVQELAVLDTGFQTDTKAFKTPKQLEVEVKTFTTKVIKQQKAEQNATQEVPVVEPTPEVEQNNTIVPSTDDTNNTVSSENNITQELVQEQNTTNPALINDTNTTTSFENNVSQEQNTTSVPFINDTNATIASENNITQEQNTTSVPLPKVQALTPKEVHESKPFMPKEYLDTNLDKVNEIAQDMFDNDTRSNIFQMVESY